MSYIPVSILREEAKAIVDDPMYEGRPDVQRRHAEAVCRIVIDGQFVELQPRQRLRLQVLVDQLIPSPV